MPTARKYTRPEITVTYQPRRCIHVAECIRRAPNVFNTWEQPWVQVENGAVAEIVAAVERCPTGALHYERTDGGAAEQPAALNSVLTSRNGPYYVRGNLEIAMPDGSILEETRAALCRCGASENKPFCDNAHRTSGFSDPGLHAPVADEQAEFAPSQKLCITPQPNGNLKLEGPFELRDAAGQLIERRAQRSQQDIWLCRCGASQDKPYCDSSHKKINFTS